MEIRQILEKDRAKALELVWNVFLQYESPDYSKEGIEAFYQSVIVNEDYINNIVMYGAFENNEIKGVIATRNKGNHVALFFVDGKYHKQGIGKSLFQKVLVESTGDEITVNSSPYAVEVYRHLGFCETDTEQIEDGIRYTPMKYQKSYLYTKIRENIWQIEEENGVCCTLIKGSEMAILVDTGYGHRNLRAFVEKNISTPYIVINSHGHPDHIGGNHWFDEVYAIKKEWDVIKHFEEPGNRTYELKELQVDSHISLGDIQVDVVLLEGHTKGSIGLLVLEEQLLIAGDALNEGLWLFNYGSLSMKKLYETMQKVMQMKFSTYLCGHSNQEYKKEKLLAHIHNLENLKVDENTKQDTIGFETYCSSYEDSHGKSEIVFTIDRLEV